MNLDKTCFKIDKTNAKAMIKGHYKNNKLIRQAIWCDVEANPFPMLITLNRTPPRFPMSWVGYNLCPESFHMPYKYIAMSGEDFFIKNDMRLWDIVCNNGLFDVWLPEAPFKRFAESKSSPDTFRIQLIRVWKTKGKIWKDEIIHVNSRIDHLRTWQKPVPLDEPVIPDNEFSNIKKLLVKSIDKFRTR